MQDRYSPYREAFSGRLAAGLKISLCVLGVCAAIFGPMFARQANWSANSYAAPSLASSENRVDRVDRDLSVAAASALSHHAVSASPRSPFAQSPLRPVPFLRRTLASEHFRVIYPANIDETQAEHVLRVIESSREDLLRRVSAAGVSVHVPTLELFINETTGDFVGRTGQPPWAAAATRGDRVELQPLELLKRRRILETTLRHELVHAMIEAIGRGRAPRWLAEGLALHIVGEGPKVAPHLRKTHISIADLEQRLSRPARAEDMRADYAAAYREVKRLVATEGESAVWRLVVAHR